VSIRILDLQLIYGAAGARNKFDNLCKELIQAEFLQAKGIQCYPGERQSLTRLYMKHMD
jgi:hypothetical protein